MKSSQIMRLITVMGVAVTLFFVAEGTAGSLGAAKTRCATEGSTLSANGRYRVFDLPDRGVSLIYVCSSRTGARRSLGIVVPDGDQGLARVRLAGGYVAYEGFYCSPHSVTGRPTALSGQGDLAAASHYPHARHVHGPCSGAVFVRKAATGRPVAVSRGFAGRVVRLVLDPGGVASWTARADDGTVHVRSMDRDGELEHDHAVDIDAHSLAMAGGRIYWSTTDSARSVKPRQ